jgi:hypothetical protein
VFGLTKHDRLARLRAELPLVQRSLN